MLQRRGHSCDRVDKASVECEPSSHRLVATSLRSPSTGWHGCDAWNGWMDVEEDCQFEINANLTVDFFALTLISDYSFFFQ
jgi:hypothetical protein